MRPCIVIPARYNSTRFPGKVLVEIMGKTVLQRVWEKCIPVVGKANVYIATDDDRISDYCKNNEMQYIMTSDKCKTGTDRIAEAVNYLSFNYREYMPVINVQGDEPLVSSESIKRVIDNYVDSNEILCGYCKIETKEEFESLNTIKVVMNKDSYLLYASRGKIPATKKGDFKFGNKQVCIYAFSPMDLQCFACYENKTPLEEVEDIELLRFLENGYRIRMVKVSGNSHAIDVPEDVEIIENILRNENGYRIFK